MNSILETISQRHADQKPTEIDVPEWGAKLYFTPLTAAERASIRKGVDPDDDGEMLIASIIRKARDKDGKPAFEDNAETRAILAGKAEFSIIRRIIQEADGPQEKITSDDLKNV